MEENKKLICNNSNNIKILDVSEMRIFLNLTMNLKWNICSPVCYNHLIFLDHCLKNSICTRHYFNFNSTEVIELQFLYQLESWKYIQEVKIFISTLLFEYTNLRSLVFKMKVCGNLNTNFHLQNNHSNTTVSLTTESSHWNRNTRKEIE